MAATLPPLVIPGGKLADYLLDLAHPKGGSKARLLIARGFSRARPAVLGDALRAQATSPDSIVTVSGGVAPFSRYVVDGPLAAPDGSILWFRTVWLDTGQSTASLLTAYPARDGRR